MFPAKLLEMRVEHNLTNLLLATAAALEAGLKPKEFVFARYVAEGMEITQAYKKVFKKSKSSEYIANSAKQLMKKEEVKTMVKEEIKKTFRKTILRHKNFTDTSKNEN